MRLTSKLFDKKINAANIQIEIRAKEYVEIARKILNQNIFQRKRVKNAGSIYSLLKSDIIAGCLIPPVVLSSSEGRGDDFSSIDEEFIFSILYDHKNLRILDGLQRTYTLLEIFDDAENQIRLEDYYIRVELYLGINEIGILYRMLTLNAGQTPMSLRHQIEILYSNFADSTIGEINILRQVDEENRSSHNDYNFSDLIEGYNSYLERNESPIDRYSLLEIVRSIENISRIGMDSSSFTKFTTTHHAFVSKIVQISGNWSYPINCDEIPEELSIDGAPFGRTIYNIFNRAQSLSGFGAAIGNLIDQKAISSLEEIEASISSMEIQNPQDALLLLTKSLDEVKRQAKKIGISQRMFFRYFYKFLLDGTDRELYRNIEGCCEAAKKRTLSNM